MPKPTAKTSSSERRHIPLADEITSAGHLRTKSGSKRKSRSEDETEDDHYLDSKSSKKILQIGRDLAEEDAAETRAAAEAAGIDLKAKAAFDFESRLAGEESRYEDDEDIVQYDDDAQWEDEGEIEEVVRFHGFIRLAIRHYQLLHFILLIFQLLAGSRPQ